ncbi:hypothetical protein Nepgr_003044 [Nepenthes gracilis]|uniref:Uncharacterized protein n=1 Tax=Nepenthes gracilis TaxID=150966 RepID=A0AAD3RYS7_NEPGR|nr:hypothetical protein Nepgr_003044 [Nepenthes gracilis]
MWVIPWRVILCFYLLTVERTVVVFCVVKNALSLLLEYIVFHSLSSDFILLLMRPFLRFNIHYVIIMGLKFGCFFSTSG